MSDSHYAPKWNDQEPCTAITEDGKPCVLRRTAKFYANDWDDNHEHQTLEKMQSYLAPGYRIFKESDLCTSTDPNDHQGDTCPVHEQ